MTIAREDSLALRLGALQLPGRDADSQFVSPRWGGWLGDHQDEAEAAELAALLHEAAPKLAFASLRAPRLPGSGRTPLPKARSYEVSESVRDRLRAAAPIPTGPGQVDWSRLTATISSEHLKFEEASAAVARAAAAAIDSGGAAAACDDGAPSPACTPAGLTSPRGGSGGLEVLDINSGGRVIFCLFAPAGQDPPRAPTPPSSLRSSPEKGYAGCMDLAAGPDGGGGLCREPSLRKPPLGASSGSASPAGSTRSRGCWEGSDSGSDGSNSGYAEERLRQLQAAAVGQHPCLVAAPAQQRPGSSSSSGGSGRGGSDADLPHGAAPAEHALHEGAAAFSFASAEDDGSAPPSPVLLPASAPAVQSLAPSARRPSLAGAPSLSGGAPTPEGCLILKFVSSRLLSQSEQFASELTRHVGLCTPDSRILRQKGHSDGEWQQAYEAAEALRDSCPDLHEEMARSSCCLVMEFIPGGCLFRSPQAFADGGALQQTAEDLGRLFTLDMLLGNADRLHCTELGWRGNPENILYATSGRWAGRAVAIDAVVQRRPPGGLMSAEDSSCERLTELALNDGDVACTLLRQALRPCCVIWGSAQLKEGAAAFQRGLKAALDAANTIKGLMEMMFDVITDWIHSFIEDIEEAEAAGHGHGGHGSAHSGAPAVTPRSASASRRASSAGGATSPLLLTASASTSAQTMRIRQINHEAQRNDSVGERVAHWKAVFREKGEELRAAVEEWQAKQGPAPAGAQRLTTAFLDGTHPVVDVYELKVRLEHMLQRLRVLQQATLTGRPCRLMPRLYLSGAVEASSLHMLRHLGITHVLNATEDLLLPEEGLGFTTLRCPLRDVEEEDITPHLPDASAFIDEGLASGGSVLVHCHAGKSRSCSLVLSWLMTRRRWDLNRALQFLRRARPEAEPNAGYLAALLRLEEELFGRQTVKMKKTKPEPRSCPVCSERVGLSADSVRVHLRLKHPGVVLARSGRVGSIAGSDSGGWSEVLGSPTGSSPRSSKAQSLSSAGGSGTWLPARGAGGPAEALHPRHLHQQQQQQHADGGQAQQQAAAAAAAAAAAEWPARPASAPLSPPALPRVATAPRPGTACAAGAVLDSPPSMFAAVLQGMEETGDLTDEDEEAFLSSAAATGGDVA
ncbi:MAP kinase phosphatase with leucine-rich repeats 3 [Micractinium conductrix]|uniref:MAP kinase phosphatase with leucine-rich repeats 3 n=1 Tax=Micractinium conductrix TaxID=554055 RepID=A0A2P6VK31_9CHLO|nr:MAP kinase phosphatase with leucine-rich repeats 3 [Micractinium conductrix]|eukprot:PSC74445.1 MAP kinase phosphatase with leucine-rich repeats 3 [Micractinium conductrix]